MLGWIAVLLIGGFLVGCAVIITASCYQILKTVKKTKQPSDSKVFPALSEV